MRVGVDFDEFEWCLVLYCQYNTSLAVVKAMDKLPSHTFERIRQRRRLPASKFLIAGWHFARSILFRLPSFDIRMATLLSCVIHTYKLRIDNFGPLNVKHGIRVPHGFHHRAQSDRFVPSTPPTLIKNATIWTGGNSGHQVIIGNLLLDKGLFLIILQLFKLVFIPN